MPRKYVPKPGRDRRMNKHLPMAFWPAADNTAFERIFAPGDLFDDDRPAGAHLSDGARRHIRSGWARFLGFLRDHDPDALLLSPVERLTPARLKAFTEDLGAQVRQTTVASNLDGVYQAARLIAPDNDWRWFKSAIRQIEAQAEPINRFTNLTEPTKLLALGLKLMDDAATLPPDPWARRETQYRDGLVLVLLSLWPIRRRSLAALTLSRHIERMAGTYRFHLHPEDTKAKRAETFVMPEILSDYIARYLETIRQRLVGNRNHDAFWVADQGQPLTGDGLYQIVRKHTLAAFGKPMGLHDVRRATATFIAIERPDLVGIMPGVLQHAGPATAQQHYNLAGSAKASSRYLQTISGLKDDCDSQDNLDNGNTSRMVGDKIGQLEQRHRSGAPDASDGAAEGPGQQSSILQGKSMSASKSPVSKLRLTASADSPNLFEHEARNKP
jgi:site-specific recombinase XerD